MMASLSSTQAWTLLVQRRSLNSSRRSRTNLSRRSSILTVTAIIQVGRRLSSERNDRKFGQGPISEARQSRGWKVASHSIKFGGARQGGFKLPPEERVNNGIAPAQYPKRGGA